MVVDNGGVEAKKIEIQLFRITKQESQSEVKKLAVVKDKTSTFLLHVLKKKDCEF